MTTKELEKAVAAYCENPYWRNLYESAPKGAQEYLAATFAASESDADDAGDFVQGVEKRLGKSDRDWLAKNLPNAQARSHFKAK